MTEPSNRAADRIRAELPRWADRAYVANAGRAALASTFVHEDRRPLVATPSMDRDAYITNLLTMFDEYEFEQRLVEVVAVRGERACLFVREVARDGCCLLYTSDAADE